MDSFFNAIQKTPLPTILILAGLLFIFLGFITKLGGIIEVSSEQKRWTIPIGLLVLTIGLVLNFATPASNTTTAPTSASSKISVLNGSYGENCGTKNHGNDTVHLASQCDGREVCDYITDYKIIGDPSEGCLKEYSAEWKCGDNPKVQHTLASKEAGYGTKITLSCH